MVVNAVGRLPFNLYIHIYLWTMYFIFSVLCVQEFYKQPTNQSAVEGSTVVLRCIIKNRVGKVQWTRGGFGLGMKRDLPGFDRYTVIGTKAIVDDRGMVCANTE